MLVVLVVLVTLVLLTFERQLSDDRSFVSSHLQVSDDVDRQTDRQADRQADGRKSYSLLHFHIFLFFAG